MANAYKCDRCGSYFSRKSPHYPRYKLYAEVKNVRNESDYSPLDLCDDCERSIQRFADDTNIQLVFKPFEIYKKG